MLYTSIHIYIYTPGTQMTSIFWRSTPQKQGLFQSKQGSFGFQVYIYILLYTYVLYLYTYVHMHNNLHSMVKTKKPHTSFPTRAWAVNMAPKENCKVKCRPPPPVAKHGGFGRAGKGWWGNPLLQRETPQSCGVFFWKTTTSPGKMEQIFLTLKSDLPSFFTAFAVSFPGFRFFVPRIVRVFTCFGLSQGDFFFQVIEGLQWMKLGRRQQSPNISGT